MPLARLPCDLIVESSRLGGGATRLGGVQLTSHNHDRYDRNSDDCRAYLLFATDRKSLTPQFHGALAQADSSPHMTLA